MVPEILLATPFIESAILVTLFVDLLRFFTNFFMPNKIPPIIVPLKNVNNSLGFNCMNFAVNLAIQSNIIPKALFARPGISLNNNLILSNNAALFSKPLLIKSITGCRNLLIVSACVFTAFVPCSNFSVLL